MQDINEAKYAGETDHWIIINVIDGEFSAHGPFPSKGDANTWWKQEVERYDLVLDDTTTRFVQVHSPE